MRSLVLAAGLLLPAVGWAQLFGNGKFEDGSYVLADSRHVRHPGQLRLDGGSKLLLKTPDGKKTKLSPAQVYSFRLGQRRYTIARDFRVQGGFGINVDEAFVEQLDSGQVMLMRYEYEVGDGTTTGTYGITTSGTTSVSAYLLRRPTDDTYVSVQPGHFATAGGNRFRDAVRPFLTGRPDLLKLLDEKHLTMDNLPAVIHALNTNKPYTLPLSHYDLMKQQALAKQAKKVAAADSARH